MWTPHIGAVWVPHAPAAPGGCVRPRRCAARAPAGAGAPAPRPAPRAQDEPGAVAVKSGLAAARLELDTRSLRALAIAPAATNNQRLGLAVGMLAARGPAAAPPAYPNVPNPVAPVATHNQRLGLAVGMLAARGLLQHPHPTVT
jgi:hypothetical protein